MTYEHGEENADNVPLTEEQKQALKLSSEMNDAIASFLRRMESLTSIDGRSMSLAKTNFEQGRMWLNKGISKSSGL